MLYVWEENKRYGWGLKNESSGEIVLNGDVYKWIRGGLNYLVF